MTILDDAPPRTGATLPSHPTTAHVAPAPAGAAQTSPGEVWTPPPSSGRLRQLVGRLFGYAPRQETPEERGRRHARRFFWAWLLFAMTVSVGANVIYHWMTAPSDDLRLTAAIMAAIPPLLLLGATHSVVLLLKNRRRRYRRIDAVVLGVDLVMIVVVAGCAFTQSFYSIRALVIMLGQNPDVAPLWPIGVDVSLICSTLALLAITGGHDDAEDEGHALIRFVAPAPGHVPHAADGDPTAVVHAGPSSPAERRLWWESIAAVIRERRPDVRKFGDLTNGQLAEILERMYDHGESGRVIVDTTILHNREIQVIKKIVPELLASTAVVASAAPQSAG